MIRVHKKQVKTNAQKGCPGKNGQPFLFCNPLKSTDKR
jgi:hypothetical protein